MHILVVVNGVISNTGFYKKIINEADKVIAADGGADNCIKLGINPDYVVGDLDSISQKARKRFEKILIHVKDQNTTDFEKAINLAKKLGCSRLTVIGAIGRRVDHTISNILTLLKVRAPSEIFDETNNVYLVEKEIELFGKKGDNVSVIAISNVKSLDYTGLKWKIKGKNISAGWLGTSNQMTGKSAKITLKSGKIIVIKSRD